MKITKRQLKRIIREEYSRLKRRGLIREAYGQEGQLPRDVKELEDRHDDLLSFMNGQASSPMGSDEDLEYNIEQVLELEKQLHDLRKGYGLPPKDYVEYSSKMYRSAHHETMLRFYDSKRRQLANY
jgi:hypothetical protein